MEVREMSLAPLCRFCQTRHWGACKHIEDISAITNRIKEVITTPESVTKDDVPNVPNVPNRSEYQRVKAWKIANREKYNSKMKEVMRNKRAKKREDK